MVKEPQRISFDEFALHLRTVFDTIMQQREAVLIEKDGQFYRLEPEQVKQSENIWASYDLQKVREALQKSAGALFGVDRDALLTDIHTARQQKSHGRPA
ncbi:MAG: hypothetical protein HY731_02400 [Candidatus Tectomicrobia bacterium]|nr:hypothetical protein [Candidatus Tectomicrobia bacterium]